MILLVLLLAFIIRIINLNQSLWWDEANNIIAAQTSSLTSFITQYTIADFHPPGYFTLLWVWGHIFGFSEISARMPSVILGVLTVYLTYLVGKELSSKRAALVAALFISLGPLHIYYSQEARMYSLAAFSVACSMYFLILLLKRSRCGFLGYAFSIFLVLYSDYVAYFVIPAQVAYVFFCKKDHFQRFFLALGLGLTTLLPWLLVLPAQFSNGQATARVVSGWQNVVGGTAVKTIGLLPLKTLVGRISFDNKLFYGLFAGITGLPYLILLTKLVKVSRSALQLLCFWLLVPPLLAFLFSFYIPVFSYFRFVFLLPAFYLFAATLAGKFSGNGFWILVGSVVVTELFASGAYIINTNFYREDWRSASNFTNTAKKGENAVIFEYDTVPSAYAYYNSSLSGVLPGLKRIPARTENDVANFSQAIQDKRGVFLFEYLVDITDPQRLLERELGRLGFQRSLTYNFRGVGFVHLYRKTTGQ